MSKVKLVFVRFISSRWNCSLRKKYVLFLDTKLIHWLKNIRKIDSLIVITNDVRDVITHTIHFQSCFDHIFVTSWSIDSMLCTHSHMTATKTSFNASRSISETDLHTYSSTKGHKYTYSLWSNVEWNSN